MAAEWTVLVFLNAKNNLEPFAFPNFEQMASIGSTPEVNVIVELGRPKTHFDARFGAWSKSLRFLVGPGTQPIENQALADLGDRDMGDAKTLTDFVAWGRAKYPAKRTMLVIWNHGQGFRAPLDERGARRGPAVEAKTAGGHRYVSNDDDTGNKLYNRAIQDALTALTALLAGHRLDIIAFDACLMAMVETAYALRGVARVMVGSQELEPGNGWDYASWLKPLVDKRGDVEPAELGRLLVDGMRATYGDDDATTLSATDLDRVAAVGAALSAFADVAMPALQMHVGAFRAARDACDHYAPNHNIHSIDCGRYFDQIAASRLPDAIVARARDVRIAHDTAVIASYASVRRQGRFGSHGLGLYYPASGAAYRGDPDRDGYDPTNTEFPLEFVQNERWAGFVHGYCGLVP